MGRRTGAVTPIPRPLEPPRHSPHPQALPLPVRGPQPPKPSIGQHLQDLGIQWQRRLSQLPLKEDLIHQLPKPGQGAEAAAIAEIHQGLGAKPLEIGAAGLVRMGHEGAQRRTRKQGGAGSRPRCSGPGPILEAAPQTGEAWAEPVHKGRWQGREM